MANALQFGGEPGESVASLNGIRFFDPQETRPTELRQMEEEPSLTPTFHTIFKELNHRQELLRLLATQSVPFDDSMDVRTHPETQDLIRELQAVDVELLRALVSLLDAMDVALRGRGIGENATQTARRSKLTKIALNAITSTASPSDDCCLVLRKCNADGSIGPINEVILGTILNHRAIPYFGLALDILQYWEILLRYQTKIPCSEFCEGVRRSLSPRIKTLLNYDSMLRRLPTGAPAPTTSPLFDALRKDITDRLERVSIHLDQIDSLQDKLRQYAESDLSKSAKREKLLYAEELATVLYELVHLSDNARKLLTASNEDVQQLQFIEELTCYRVAACFINTRKHGIRGRNKASAVVDYEFVASSEGKIHFFDLLINYKGEAWQATNLIRDLLHVWEIFLRYYSTVEFPAFRSQIGNRFDAQKELSTYRSDLEETIAEELKRKFEERLQYNI